MNRFDFTFKADQGYTYRPFTNGVAVGYIVTAPNGKREVVFLNPSGGTDDGFADIAVCQVELEPDVVADNDGYLDNDKIYDPQTMLNLAPFDVETTADAIARNDLATMSIGAEPTAQELALRTTEYVGRLTRELSSTEKLDFMAMDRRRDHHGVLLDLQLVEQWLHLYGVAATIRHTGGNAALLSIAGGEAHLGPGWFEGTSRQWRAFAGTDDAVIALGSNPGGGIRAQWTELETAWMAINILTSRPVFTYTDHTGARSPAKAAPVGAPIVP